MIKVKDLMTEEVVTIGPDEAIKDAIEKIIAGRFRRIPVIKDEKVVGIITDRDIRQALNSPVIFHERSYDDFLLREIRVASSMTHDPITIGSEAELIEAAELMENRKIGGLPVVDGGALVGIITLSDLVKFLIQSLGERQDQ